MSDSLRRLAAQIVGLKRDVLQLQTAPRAGQTSIEHGGAITVVDPETGTATARLGTQTDGTYGAVTLDGPIPPTPTAPILDVAPGLVAVTWDGTHADGAATPLDFHAVEVYVAAEPFAFIEEGTLSGSLVGSDGDRITIALAPGVWHVGLVTVSQAMKRSRLSSLAIATVSALPSDEDIALAGGRVTISDDEPEVADAEGKPDSALWQQVVDDVLVGAWRLDAAVPEWRPIEVAPGTPYMPKIDLGTATVGLLTGARLAADAIDGKTITGATFRTGASVGAPTSGQGVILDSNGLRAHRGDGSKPFEVKASDGSVYMEGEFVASSDGGKVRLTGVQYPGSVVQLPVNEGQIAFLNNDNTLRARLVAYNTSINPSSMGNIVLESLENWTRSLDRVTLTAAKKDPIDGDPPYSGPVVRSDIIMSSERWDAGSADVDRGGISAIARGMTAEGSVNGQFSAGIRISDPGEVQLFASPLGGTYGNDDSSQFLLRGQYIYLCQYNEKSATSGAERFSLLRFNTALWRWESRPTYTGTWVADVATETKVGPVELATAAEVLAGTDATRAVTPAALASWRDSHFYLAKKTANQTGIVYPASQITGLTLSAPWAGRARIQISCTSQSSASDDLVAYEIRLNGVKIKRGTQLANSSSTGRGHLLEMTAITTLAAGVAITVWAERPVGPGAVEIIASPTDPCTLTLEYV